MKQFAMKTAEKDSFLRDVTLHTAILKEFGRELGPDSQVLDFGCGSGNLVLAYREAGLKAFGVDVILAEETEFLRLIPKASYRIPFEDNTFDFLFSNSVLEHVRDLPAALTEMKRVLKPRGVSLHLFPPKARPIEPHVFVPWGGLIRNRPWLLLWASLGVRSPYQKGLDIRQVAEKNYNYLHDKTFYRSRQELQTQICAKFQNLVFADSEMIKCSYGGARRLSPFIKILPSLARCYGAFHNRCIFFEKLAA